jgi:hypothetical protein
MYNNDGNHIPCVSKPIIVSLVDILVVEDLIYLNTFPQKNTLIK